MIRPEEISIDQSHSASTPKGRISKIDYYGHDAMITVDVAGKAIKVRVPGPFEYAVGDEVSLHHNGPVRFFSDSVNS